MVLDKLEHLISYIPSYHSEINNFLRLVSPTMKDGEYPIVGENVFARVMNYATKPEDDCRIEAHDVYVDIQSVLTGAEGIGIFGRESLKPSTAYDKDNDVVYFEKAWPLYTVSVNEGYFAIIFPHEAHRPQTAVKQPENIRKFVIKIKGEMFGL